MNRKNQNFRLKMHNHCLSNGFPIYSTIFAFLLSNFAPILAISSAENSTILNETSSSVAVILCADGKGPLLEGEERIFPCGEQCPAGFECESLKGVSEGGICCPNLGELYRLYNAGESDEENGGNGKDGGGERKEREDGEGKQSTRDEQESGGVNAMALLEEHYGEKIVRSRPKPRSVSPSSDRAEAAALIRSRPIEIRRSQPRWGEGLSEANIWRPRAQFARPSIGPAKKGGAGNVDASGEEFSCRRQRLELFCEDGRRRTQFVMRWYAKEGRCYTYPWGYCPGEPVASDRTLRTREECELLCTDPLDAGHDSPVVNVVRFGIGDGVPQQKQQILDGNEERQQKLEFLKKQHQEGEREEQEGLQGENHSSLAAAAPNQDVLAPEEQTTEFGIGNGAGVESGAPEPIDLSAAPGDDPQQQQSPSPPHHQQSAASPPSSSSTELAEFLLADQRPVPKRKRCEKVSPYRAMCPQDGMPSQFTLRWYQRGQACFAYPYGYCHGESVFAEEPIKTERECLAICVQKRESIKGLAGLRARRRLLRRS